jgi:GNAT superfamily N-acetyltransferase
MTYAIREALPDDALAIAALACELGYPTGEDAMRRRLATILQKADHRLCVAVDNGGTVIGWIQAHAADSLESGLRVEIVGLVVAGSARRVGVGRRLVDEVERWAGDMGCEVVGVRSNIKRVESHIFYPALGYEAVKTQVAYRKMLKRGR